MVERVQVAFRMHQSVMVQMPTGTGKTYLLVVVVGLFVQRECVWIVARRRELVSQIEETMQWFYGCESYSVGTPVIGARIGGIPEIVVENETGYQFASGDSGELKDKVQLADGLSEEEYIRLSKGTLKFAHENLSLESYYPKLIGFHQQITIM